VARALATEPRLLLLDEPFGALDPETRAALQGELLALQRRLGFTALLVSHDLGEALRLATRCAVLVRGELVQVAPPADLVRAPASEEVARLLSPALERARALAELAT
jgi:osmoprotectant transport system ATP-binding protein